ncbi:MAG TPA: efflux RND transporter periplasmic adaptor subunit, partial [Tepidisphaeraceae bacterium]
MEHPLKRPGSTPAVGVGLLLIAGLLCGSGGCQKEEASEQKAAPPEVVVVSVGQRDVPIYQEWVGTLAGEVNATISAQASGYLIRREYTEGSPVKKDQVLFQIDRGPFEAALEIARAQLAVADAQKGKTVLDVKRYTPLAEKDAVSKQELDDAIQADKVADGQIAMANAKVQEAQLNLGFTTIRSPVDGVAGISKAQVGDLIGPNTGQLTTVLQINPMRAYFTISQQLVAQLQQRLLAENKSLRRGDEGPELQLTLANGYVYPIKGKARFGDNQVDVRTGSVQIIGEFPNPDGFLVPGMFARIRALMRTDKDALVVPQRAVAQVQGRYLVAIVGADKKVTVRPVSAGERVGDDWVIRGDVK